MLTIFTLLPIWQSWMAMNGWLLFDGDCKLELWCTGLVAGSPIGGPNPICRECWPGENHWSLGCAQETQPTSHDVFTFSLNFLMQCKLSSSTDCQFFENWFYVCPLVFWVICLPQIGDSNLKMRNPLNLLKYVLNMPNLDILSPNIHPKFKDSLLSLLSELDKIYKNANVRIWGVFPFEGKLISITQRIDFLFFILGKATNWVGKENWVHWCWDQNKSIRFTWNAWIINYGLNTTASNLNLAFPPIKYQFESVCHVLILFSFVTHMALHQCIWFDQPLAGPIENCLLNGTQRCLTVLGKSERESSL